MVETIKVCSSEGEGQGQTIKRHRKFVKTDHCLNIYVCACT